MTTRKFNRLYEKYKNVFDLELMLKLSGKTFSKAEQEALTDDDWIK